MCNKDQSIIGMVKRKEKIFVSQEKQKKGKSMLTKCRERERKEREKKISIKLKHLFGAKMLA